MHIKFIMGILLFTLMTSAQVSAQGVFKIAVVNMRLLEKYAEDQLVVSNSEYREIGRAVGNNPKAHRKDAMEKSYARKVMMSFLKNSNYPIALHAEAIEDGHILFQNPELTNIVDITQEIIQYNTM